MVLLHYIFFKKIPFNPNNIFIFTSIFKDYRYIFVKQNYNIQNRSELKPCRAIQCTFVSILKLISWAVFHGYKFRAGKGIYNVTLIKYLFNSGYCKITKLQYCLHSTCGSEVADWALILRFLPNTLLCILGEMLLRLCDLLPPISIVHMYVTRSYTYIPGFTLFLHDLWWVHFFCCVAFVILLHTMSPQ